MQSSGYKVRFASLSVDTALTANVIDYSYDAIGRLQDAVYADSSRYDYDVAGNRLQEQVMIDNTGTPVITTTNWTYNNANQIATMQIGSNPVSNFQYDANGNLSSDGQLTYTWDRANRLTTLNNGSYNTHYAYDGNSNRVQQTIGGIATDYLLDIQPQLALVLKETTPSETLTYVHSPRSVHSVEDNTGDWHFMVGDGLGSVRSQVDDLAQVEASQAYSPYGQVYGVEGTFAGTFGYTGEQVDDSGMSYLRARYYDPTQATFASLDPFEGKSCTPMSLNGYAYVHGNPIMNTDPTGMMVAGRIVNIDTSGTSRILQSWSNALKGAFTIPSLSLVKSMNSGMCGDGRVGNVSKPDPRFYSRGGDSDVRQDDSYRPVNRNCAHIDYNIEPERYGTCLSVYSTVPNGWLTARGRCAWIRMNARRMMYEAQYEGVVMTGCERLATLIEIAASHFSYNTAAELSDDISCALTGSRGPATAVHAASGATYPVIGNASLHHPSDGWNPDYYDNTLNQAFHLWANLNMAAQGAPILVGISNWTHECLAMGVIPFPRSDLAGASMPDVRLTMMGRVVGEEIASGNISPIELGGYVRRVFCDEPNSQNFTLDLGIYNNPIGCPFIQR